MSTEITVPSSGESVSEVEIGEWTKSSGDRVEQDETIAVLETDKASMELPAPAAGVLSEIRVQAGERVAVGDVIGLIDDGEGSGGNGRGEREPEPEPKAEEAERLEEERDARERAEALDRDEADEDAEDEVAREKAEERERDEQEEDERDAKEQRDTRESETQGHGSRSGSGAPKREQRDAGKPRRVREDDEARAPRREPEERPAAEDEEVVPMSLLRRTIARRLVEAQNTAALLTTFNEIDMTAAQDMRKRWREEFQERHGVKLGIMPLFVKAVIEACKEHPEMNAEVRGTDMVFKKRFDVGIAVGTERGLVVPVLRSADRMSLAEIEKTIADFARRARENRLEMDELSGGTFTITNGGVYGSLMSTPIVSPPQTGVLGMHAIQDRPIVEDGEVVVRPMMYVALTYDHRIADGRTAVQWLKRVKEIVEAPERLILEA